MMENKDEAKEKLVAEEGQSPEDKKAARSKKIKKEIREWVVSLLVALVVVMLIRTFLFTIIRVDGDSMNYTLADNERMFVTVLDKRLYGVERGDVVICHYPNRGRTYFVKRVRGVPGDTVERVNGVTYINGTALDVKYESASKASLDYSYVLGEDDYFVVGDNTYNSHDSRYWQNPAYSEDYVVGPISLNMIVGKVRCVIWPLNEIRAIEQLDDVGDPQE